LLLAVLSAATKGRRRLLSELAAAAVHAGPYRDSAEELTPLRRDPISALPVARIVAALLAHPENALTLTTGSIAKYSLSPGTWRQVCDSVPAGDSDAR
jgi:hypothetical protein